MQDTSLALPETSDTTDSYTRLGLEGDCALLMWATKTASRSASRGHSALECCLTGLQELQPRGNKSAAIYMCWSNRLGSDATDCEFFTQKNYRSNYCFIDVITLWPENLKRWYKKTHKKNLCFLETKLTSTNHCSNNQKPQEKKRQHYNNGNTGSRKSPY